MHNPAAGAQVGATESGAQVQGSGPGNGPGATLVMGPQAGAGGTAQSTLGAVGVNLPSTGVLTSIPAGQDVFLVMQG